MTQNDRVFFNKVNDLQSSFHDCHGAYEYDMGFIPMRLGCWIDNNGVGQGLTMFQLLEHNKVFTEYVTEAVFEAVALTDELIMALIENTKEN